MYYIFHLLKSHINVKLLSILILLKGKIWEEVISESTKPILKIILPIEIQVICVSHRLYIIQKNEKTSLSKLEKNG